jgi:hypothetical protein
VITRYKVGKHFNIAITDDSLTIERRQDRIDEEAALDGFYVLRTPVPASELDAPAVVAAYESLKHVATSTTRPAAPTAVSAASWSTRPP